MKIAVFYYTQSGQALNVARSICSKMNDVSVVYKEIVPLTTYPFPWSKNAFFDAFPETRLGIPPSGIVPMDFSDVEDAGLVLVVGQSWFLSPSLPLQSFFTDEQVKQYLSGRKVVFVNACRNMWLMTSRKVKAYLSDAHAKMVGQIVLQDEAPNLVSVITVIRWLIYGKKEGNELLPSSGISDASIKESSRFGVIIADALRNNDLSQLQELLLSAGAIKYKASILFLEKAGHRMFGLWAKFVRKKGNYGNPRRIPRLNLFYAYLLTVLFVVSPFGQLFFYLTYPLQQVSKNKKEDCCL
jgi:hypothetical protein